MRAWVNGRILDDIASAALRVDDHGFTVGDGVFETMKVVEGRAFAVRRHLDRLERSAAGLGLAVPERSRVEEGIRAALEGQHQPLGRIRITVSGGPAPLGSGRGEGPQSLVVIAGPAEPWEATTAVATVPWPRNERSAVAGLKTTSYAENVVALAAAHGAGATEAVLANTVGHLCEGTGSNVFYVVDGELRTPALSTGCLAGVTRALVLEWCGGVECEEPVDVLTRAEEVFLTSSTRDVHPVRRVDEREIDAPGPVTRAVMATWQERSAADIDP
ncbi:MAG: aminotransferase class IV [Marmoricola sp.]